MMNASFCAANSDSIGVLANALVVAAGTLEQLSAFGSIGRTL
jgi:hypothetical protein